jgi:hypothetical protein
MRSVQHTQHLLLLTARVTETQGNVYFVIDIAGSQSFGSRGCNSKYCNIVRRDTLFGKSVWAICPYHVILIF